MKMRVIYYSKSKKIADIAEYLSKNSDEYKPDTIPPDYSLDKEKLLVLGMSKLTKLPDDVRRFCMNLKPATVRNIALYTDRPEAEAKEFIKQLKESGANIFDNVLYVKSEFLSFKKASDEEKKAADEWFESILPQLK
ncbi:MAG: flavodoxin family protein [Clostridia bacterium]|jgi:flavodoxin|nr:flavodoxin family protein [Clostridia bacterium]